MSTVTTIKTTPPAAMDADLERAVAVFTNRLDPAGTGHEIAHELAPTREQRSSMQARVSVIADSLRGCGRRFAAAEVGGLILVLRLRGNKADTSTVSDKHVELYVSSLADMPAFAVIEACADYLHGRAGDRKWMPEVPELRVRVLDKIRTLAAERQRIESVLRAKVRSPRATPERRAATVAMARNVAASIALAGRRAEAHRAGLAFDPDAEARKVETPDEALARMAKLATQEPVKLSPDLRRRELIRRGVDVDALDEAAEMQRSFDEQGHAA